ncbi:hypothetical protein Swoo_3062 [Shewanella woodyi ATCC 51908]|uniref:Uncharacterized protein n=2 Tax=Shewanella woodyi TaxID=60961 RepID=B1KLN6_SHEWM|nr:hypothetical protein Swoo_3062 [Shewanella woodyi ATCC 51908]
MQAIRLILLMVLSFATEATTWGESEVDDPIVEGEKCSVYEPLSYGGYIYNWPSKYDQVFWPLTDYNGIWFCEKSGFTSFIGDFSALTVSELAKIKKYLLENPPKDSSIHTKLALLEALYSLRDTDTAFKNRLLRVFARWHQHLENYDKANDYRRKALAGIELALQGDMSEFKHLEYLYLAANYSKQLGYKEASDRYISKLISSLGNIKSEDNRGYIEYLQKLYPDTNYIEAGGVLDPVLPE